VFNCSYILSNHINRNIYVTLGLLLLTLFIFVFVRNIKKTKFNYLAFFLVMVGGSLNLYERAFNGCVRDNLNFYGHIFYNINDIVVVLGLFKILSSLYYKPEGKITSN